MIFIASSQSSKIQISILGFSSHCSFTIRFPPCSLEAYPTELLKIKKPVGFKKYDKFLVTEINKYDKITNPRRIFYKMNSIQYQAIKILVASGYLDSQNFEKGIIKFSTKEFPLNFKENIEKSNKENNKLITLLIETLADINLSGHLGLKERTGLIEFRYDTI